MTDPVSTGQEEAVSASGWRSQSLWLKVMLFVSLVFVAAGVYRCSAELTPVEGPRTIRVERATIAVPDSLLAVPADSVAALASRLFVRGLREASGLEVFTQEDTSSWAAVRLHIRALPDDRIELVGTATSVLGGRRMAVVTASDSPDRLREIAAAAARDMAGELDAGVPGAPARSGADQ